MFLQTLDLSDLDHIELVASTVAPQLQNRSGLRSAHSL
jgi:hypothetical protein